MVGVLRKLGGEPETQSLSGARGRITGFFDAYFYTLNLMIFDGMGR